MVRGLAVLVGVDSGPDGASLAHACADAVLLRDMLPPAWEGVPLLDPTKSHVEGSLQDLAGRLGAEGGPLLLAWFGHGTVTATGLRLLPADSGTGGSAPGLSATDVAAWCADTGASQLLLVFDTCHSGAGTGLADMVGQILAQVQPNADRVWVGVLASCAATDRVRDGGAFAATLRRLLERGPADPDLRRRWSIHNELLRGSDLCEALMDEWDEEQQPQFDSKGVPCGLLPNPLYRPGAPEQVVEHLLLAARGGAPEEERSWFTGRTKEVDRIVGWVTDRRPGLFVVTGPAGTGKSTLVGRVVSVANPAERQRLLSEAPELGHTDPRLGSVAGNVHARGLTVDLVAQQLDEQLVRVGLLLPHEPGGRNAAELLGALQRAAEQARPDGWQPPVVVVDGLDEARRDAFPIATDLLRRLATWVVVVVATRQLPPPPDNPQTLLEALAPVGVLDLNSPHCQASSRAALTGYVVRRLAGVNPRMEPELVARHLLGMHTADGTTTAEGADEALGGEGEGVPGPDRPFLLARLVTEQLRGVPVDTGLPGWQVQVARSVDTAFDVDLARISPPRSSSEDQAGAAVFGRGLLSALTWALGAGFPEPEWQATAGALLDREVIGEDVSWVLNQLGRYVVQDSEAGVAVYRLAHQSLADHLRPRTPPLQDDPQAQVVAMALLEHYARLLASGLPVDAPTYLWLHIAGHTTSGGPLALDRLRQLTTDHPVLRGDLARAAVARSVQLRERGQRMLALPPTQEAVELFRPLAADNPAYRPDLAGSLNNLGVLLAEVGRPAEALPPTQEAIELFRPLAADNPAYRPDLAMSLTNLGVRLSEVGRPAEALPPTQEAVELYRPLAENNPAYRPDLAGSLTNLGNRLSGLGRPVDALPPTQEAIELFRPLAADNPAYRPNLASSLTNLGGLVSGLGRPVDALPPTREAIELLRPLAADNPAFRPDLASSLANLGILLNGLGRPVNALPPTQEAIALYRPLAADNPAYRPDLAKSLTNLGILLSELGRPVEALPPTQEAIELLRPLAADNPAYLPDLAGSLTNLGNRLSKLGRDVEALPPTQEAIELFRPLAADNPAYLPDLGMSLNNLGNRLSKLGRDTEALPPTQEAIERLRPLAADNPAYLPNVARSLSNLGVRLSVLGRDTEALPPTQEAIELLRPLAADNPAYLPNVAGSLSNLGLRLSVLGRDTEALPPTQEATELFRPLAADNPAFRPDLAKSLTNLGILLSGLGRPVDALPPAQEAVELYRPLAADNPGLLADLANSLSNLGVLLSELGRPLDALPPTQEAIELYRPMAAANPAILPDLARSLHNLGIRLSELGRPAGIESGWQQAIAELPSARPVLLLYRASFAKPGDSAAAPWLLQALAS